LVSESIPMCKDIIQGKQFEGLVDTGADISGIALN
ncbi:retroviral aspartyl protease family protein, partial [Chlamydia psittaci 02DC14]